MESGATAQPARQWVEGGHLGSNCGYPQTIHSVNNLQVCDSAEGPGLYPLIWVRGRANADRFARAAIRPDYQQLWITLDFLCTAVNPVGCD